MFIRARLKFPSYIMISYLCTYVRQILIMNVLVHLKLTYVYYPTIRVRGNRFYFENTLGSAICVKRLLLAKNGKTLID